MAILLNTTYSKEFSALKQNGATSTVVKVGVRYRCTSQTISDTNISHTVYFQPYLYDNGSTSFDETAASSTAARSYFVFENNYKYFWIKYNLDEASTGSTNYLTNSSSSHFWVQNTSSSSSSVTDVSSIFSSPSGGRGFIYTFTNTIPASGGSVSETVKFKIVLPDDGSSAFGGMNEASFTIDLPTPEFLDKPSNLTITYDNSVNKLFRANTDNTNLSLSWSAVSDNGSNELSKYRLRYAITSTNSTSVTLDKALDLSTTASLSKSAAGFKKILADMTEGQYIVMAIQAIGSLTTKDEYSNVVIARKNIRPSSPSTSSGDYYDSNNQVSFTVGAQNGKILTTACTFNINGSSNSAGTHTIAVNSSKQIVCYAVDALGDISSSVTKTYSAQSNLGLTFTPSMSATAIYDGDTYATKITGYSYTVSGGLANYTLVLKLNGQQIDSRTVSSASGTIELSSVFDVLNYGGMAGSEYAIQLLVTDKTGATKNDSTTYYIPNITFTVSAEGEGKTVKYYQKIEYTITPSGTTGLIKSYSVSYGGKTVSLSSSGSGTFTVSGVDLGVTTNFIFNVVDKINNTKSISVPLTRLSLSEAPPTPDNFIIDLPSGIVIKPFTKRILPEKTPTSFNASWYATNASKSYLIYLYFDGTEYNLGEMTNFSLSGTTAIHNVSYATNAAFWSTTLESLTDPLPPSYKNGIYDAELRMYGYDSTYGKSTSYAVAKTNSGGTLKTSVSFQEAPYFESGDILHVVHHTGYDNTDYINPGDILDLSFSTAQDHNNNTISYEIVGKMIVNGQEVTELPVQTIEDTSSAKEITISRLISDNTNENTNYKIVVTPYTNYGRGTPIEYIPKNPKGRVANPIFRIISSDIIDGELIVNFECTDWGGNNKSSSNFSFEEDIKYQLLINGSPSANVTIEETKSNNFQYKAEIIDTQTITFELRRLVGKIFTSTSDVNPDTDKYISSSITETFYVTTPTVAVRKNYLGINTKNPNSNADTILDIYPFNDYKIIKLHKVGSAEIITINLENNSIDGAIISGGEWTS